MRLVTFVTCTVQGWRGMLDETRRSLKKKSTRSKCSEGQLCVLKVLFLSYTLATLSVVTTWRKALKLGLIIDKFSLFMLLNASTHLG